jgi:hypothetical protein
MLFQKTDNEEGNRIAQETAETRLSVGPLFHAAYLSRLLNCANVQLLITRGKGQWTCIFVVALLQDGDRNLKRRPDDASVPCLPITSGLYLV